MEPSELEKLFEGVTESIKSYIDDRLAIKQSDPLLSRQEAADYLGIDLSTLWRYTKNNVLPAFGIENRVYYRLSDIQNALVPLNNSCCKVNHSNLDAERVSTSNKVQQ